MIKIFEKKTNIIIPKEEQKKKRDIIVKRKRIKTTYKDGAEIRKIEYEKINLTKKINESAKIIKSTNTTEEKLRQIERIAKGDK